ncbi:hypothetical protein BD94_0498 [Elizabethkingia anophelis NUHP1]|uniref:Uncharacterized protein n=1 Tax=Elizabethkingia anophelis NUHP1 TaxID=1338011 RepID=A0A077EC21_9FLAO|nr:hypothetical protein BD94_0498 [Elizabethkingia anophelis NUHP1]
MVDFYEIGWVNQYDIIQKDKIRLGVSLNNGVVISRLGDNAEKEKYIGQDLVRENVQKK